VTALRRLRSISATLGKIFVGLIIVVLLLLGLGLTIIETAWAKNRIRALIVRQANQYLTATLSIGRLEGSLLRGIQLGDVVLSRDGKPMIAIDEIALSYSIRELVEAGTRIRRLRLTRPRVVGAKQPDGRWDLFAVVKRESQEQERTGPNRPIEIQSIDVIDGDVRLRDPLDFGATHLPTHFASLNASMKFAYYPVRWQLTFNEISWIGTEPDLTVTKLAGIFGRGPRGWFFEQLYVQTPRSAFTLDGGIHTETRPTIIDLHVKADRFAFQEWSGVLRGLKNIAIEASFETSLKGPGAQLETDVRLTGTGGAIDGTFTLDTTVPGWHGSGAVDVDRLNLARWMNRPDRPSDISGHVTFDLALELGRRFPRGMYAFEGRHAMYMDYEADNIHARGQITATEVLVAHATAQAYGAPVKTTDGSIGIDEPFPFHFRGTVTRIDLRNVPATVPVPRVESLLTFDYDVTGRFSQPFIIGRAAFARSEFLGATIGAGTIGSIDTSQTPLRFAGEGDVDDLNLHRFGRGLEVGWMQDPRYVGTISGRFHVDGAGTDRTTLALTGGGALTHAKLFRGTLSDAEVSMTIERGTLRASYNGRIAGVDPSVPFADPRLESSLTGSGNVTATVRDLLVAERTTIADYDVAGTLMLERSTIRGVPIDRAQLEATLRDSTLTIARADASGPAIEGRASGTIALGPLDIDTDGSSQRPNDIQYDITHADLAALKPLTSQDAAGTVATKGRISGPWEALHAVGEASVNQLDAFGVTALTFTGQYDATVPSGDIARANARVTGHGTFLTVFGQSIRDASGTVTMQAQRLAFDVKLMDAAGANGALAGHVVLRPDRHEIELGDLTVTLGPSPWRLVSRTPPPVVTWNDAGFAVTPLELVGGNGDERIGVAGAWRSSGGGELRVTANHVFLETLQGVFERPTRYGGVVDADATIRGTRETPIVTGTVTITNGRVERVSYEKLAGKVDYTNRTFTIDMRLDQAPGIWIAAKGTVPLALFKTDLPAAPINVAITSSGVNLGLVEGVTDLVRNVSGSIQINMTAIGTSADPHFDGSVQISNAAFLVTGTGARYKNIRASLMFAQDRVTVESLHVEDNNSHALEVSGGLGTHELRVGDVEIDARAQRFEVLRNQLGRMEVDATLQIRGRFERPRVNGDVTIRSGELRVDEILDRALFQLYATEQTATTEVDAVAALNPWERLGLDIALHVPETLRLTGTDVQVSPGTPIGLGDINLRVAGDLYLYKDPQQPLYVTGSFDSVSGTYAFQGRRFEVDPASSINFRGDLNPEVYVTVRRLISGVETRVSIFGPLREPELRLASNPPLDQSDILSLIVFNTQANQLSALQQQDLLVRAAALAAGFIAAPIVTAIERQIGLDILEIEPPSGDRDVGVRVTIGQELAPGLVARFSRQFGQEPYDEARVEYYLSRILRLRATFSDAQSAIVRSQFRRLEPWGIDLLFFFSF
jgi:autotransporter translocation and assembly factor TamB